MDGVIFDIKHFAVHDGPGIRQTIFFKGCPLSCWWCHNPESQNPEIEKYIRLNKMDGMEFKKETTIGYSISSDDLFETIKRDQIFFSESNGGVTFSGGEPLMQFEFLKKVMLLCKQNSIHTALDTSGFASEHIIRKIARLTDLFLYDIKLIDNEEHIKYTGVPVSQIIKNLKWLDKNNYNINIRIPVIPGITNTHKNIEAIKKLLSGMKSIRKVDLLPYHNISRSKYLRFQKENKMGEAPAIQNSDLEPLKFDFEKMGFEVQIGG